MISWKTVFIFQAFLIVLFLFYTEGKEIDITQIVTFDLRIGERNAGSISIGLFGKVVPLTVANFANFSDPKGYNGMNYIGSKFLKVIPDVLIKGGDLLSYDGKGSISIYGDTFKDENFDILHTEPGLLTMANKGVNKNGCQFIITLSKMPWLDGKNVVFGKVIEGMDLIGVIENLRTLNDRPVIDVVIIDIGIKNVSEKLILKGQ